MAIIVGVVLFAALMESLFFPLGGDVPPIIVGVMTIVAVVTLISGMFGSS